MRWTSALLLFALLAPSQAEEPAFLLKRFEAGPALPRSPVYHLGFSTDGKHLLGITQRLHPSVWNAADGKLARKQHISMRPPTCGVIARDGSLVLLASFRTVTVMDVARADTLAVIPVSESVNALAVSPDGTLVATGSDDHNVAIWRVKGEERLHLCRGHDGYVTAAAFDPAGKVLATGAHDRTIRLWDVQTGKEIRVLTGHTDQVSALMFLPDGRRLVSASWDKTARLWDVQTGKELRSFQGHRLSLKSLSVSGNGKQLATGGLDGLAFLWEIDTGKRLQTIDASAVCVTAVALSPDGKSLAVGTVDDTITMWDTATGRQKFQREAGHRSQTAEGNPAHCIALSKDLRFLATGGDDGAIRLFEVNKDRPRIIGRQHDIVWGVAFSPDGKHVASAGRRDGTVHIWDRDKGGEVKRLTGQKGGISRVVYSKDGKMLIAAGGSFDPSIYVWDVPNSKVIHRLAGHKDYIDAIALSPDARWLASASRDTTVRLWDLKTGKEARQLGAGEAVTCLAFRPDGALLAGGDSVGSVQLWDVATGKLRSRLGDNQGLVYVGFLRDGRTLVAAGVRLDLWELAIEQERLQKAWPEGTLSALAVDPSWRRIAAAHQEAHACLYDPVGWNGKPVHLKPRELEEHWQHLGADPFKAYAAIWKLTAASAQAVPFFEHHLQPVANVRPGQIESWVEELGSDKFRVRDRATRELEAQGDRAESALRRALKKADSLEKRRRIERLLETITGSPPPERLRQLRMVEALENMATPEARRLLEKLAGGDPEARLTREAKESLRRVSER